MKRGKSLECDQDVALEKRKQNSNQLLVEEHSVHAMMIDEKSVEIVVGLDCPTRL